MTLEGRVPTSLPCTREESGKSAGKECRSREYSARREFSRV